MNPISAALTAFGRNLGLTDFRWPEASGVAAFAFDQRGTLYVETRDETVLLYLSRELARHQHRLEWLKNALRLCHYQHQWPYTAQAGLRGETQLVFLVRLPARQVTLPELEQALELLTRLHERCAAVA